MSKKVLGLDLGTNSIGWALIDKGENKIIGMGSRIIPMGTDKQDYEKGIGITKNADRRIKRTIRRMNKRYKLRRNKLLYILNELGMLPEHFRFKNGIPEPTKIQELELLPIDRNREYGENGNRRDRSYNKGRKVGKKPNSLLKYELRVKALNDFIELKELGEILYQFNKLRGYAGGNNEDHKINKNKNNEDGFTKKYEVITEKVTILTVQKSDATFKAKGGLNKGKEYCKYNVVILLNDEKVEGETELQNLEEKVGTEEDLEIRIKRNKNGEKISIFFSLPQKTNWRKQMEATEERLKSENLFVSNLHLKDLLQNKWSKTRNRVILRSRYQEEFDKIWETQSKKYAFLNDCSKEKLEKIANYIFPGKSESQEKLRNEALNSGLKHIVRNQVIYYQRPLKSQTELVSKCKFEKEEQVLANSHPLFQEFRCWDQINNIYITSKQEVWNEKKKKNNFQYTNRFLTHQEKYEIYKKLQTQKQLSFLEIVKIVKLKNDKTEYLNGMNAKAKLKGSDTIIEIKKILGKHFETLASNDNSITTKIWKALFENINNGSEYDPKSMRITSISGILTALNNDQIAVELALKLAQTIKFPRKYANLSEKAILNILPIMQLNPADVPARITQLFNLIQTGEVEEDFPIEHLEDYVISFIKQYPNAINTGGLMYAFASSLVYGKHTKETIEPGIKHYQEIQYTERNIRNPVVTQVVNETLQIVKALWKQYKINTEELEIRVELARDLKNSSAERDKIYKAQIKSQKINEKIKNRLIELKQEPTNGNLELYKLWSKQNVKDYPVPKDVNQPTQEEVEKLRLWEEQGCVSPYTLKPIPLSKLFSPERLYDIDHIIPKSRYFDNSLANKIVCETIINEEKGNRTAWEYISQQKSKFKNDNGDPLICTEVKFINHVNSIFYGKKRKNLLLEKIPLNPVERQIKDTQYISVAIKNELAKVVGSENIKTSTGEVTSFLRSRWGLKKLFMNLTEDRFRQMELWDINPETKKPNIEWVQKYFDKRKKKHIYEIKNWSKRYDNRHHAIDALVVALTEQSHIQRLNNLNKYLQDELTKRKDEFKLEVKEDENILETYFNLEPARREEIQKQIESSRNFENPFEDLISQAKNLLETMIVSIKPKEKISVISDKYDSNTPHKELKIQAKIRSALHQETNYGKTKDPKTGLLRDTKTIDLSNLSAKDVSNIIDTVLREIEIPNHKKKYESMKEAFTGEGLKAFNESRFQRLNPNKLKPPVYKVKVWYSTKDNEESTLQMLYEKNDKLSVITGDNYLFLVIEIEKGMKIDRIFDIASLYESVSIVKDALKEKNINFKQKIATKKIETIKKYLDQENFNLQLELNKKITISKGKKKDELEKKLEEACQDFKIKLSFTLQQNELVYFPENNDDKVIRFSNEELKEWLLNTENKKKFSQRIYKVAKFAGKDCYFIPHNYSSAISIPKELTEMQKVTLKEIYKEKKIPKKELNYVEYGSYRDCSPYESGEEFIKSLTEVDKKKKLSKIQESCVKVEIDWLGNIKFTPKED